MSLNEQDNYITVKFSTGLVVEKSVADFLYSLCKTFDVGIKYTKVKYRLLYSSG